jgi:dTDP-4-dehydrorhamnose reductase
VKVLILGAGGIVGQHMRLCVPSGVEAVFARRTAAPISEGINLDLAASPWARLVEIRPDVIVNLAGESSVDAVERNPLRYRYVNEGLPVDVANYCAQIGARLIHISSQSAKDPVNEYGRQKLAAEVALRDMPHVTVMRLTFILGIRPLPHVGRQNPLEAMIAGQSPQVCDRWFSPLLAMDAAELIWKEVTDPSGERLIECGIPKRTSRYDIAKLVNPDVQPCSHDDFPGLAPRPIDTTYGEHARWKTSLLPHRCGLTPLEDRAAEISMFLNRGGMTMRDCVEKLTQGFGPLHNAVSDDFRKAKPKTDEELLDWYRTTESYIWELSAYHEDPGFNYAGMVNGIVNALTAHGAKSVLCLGDGIGDLTLAANRAGLESTYHDLAGSRTAAYAAFRFWRNTGEHMGRDLTSDFEPDFRGDTIYDAVASLDFLEHVNNVEEWVRAIHAALKPGGLAVFQNAFACGSGPGDKRFAVEFEGGNVSGGETPNMLK